MSGIAEVLHNLGYRVTGSDLRASLTTERLERLGIGVSIGHGAKNLRGSDVLVVSSAIAPDNVELCAARELRIPIVPRAEMLAELMRFRHGIAIAGTHGKTTTTSLIASLLAEAGLDPTFVIGGRLNSTASHARLGAGRYLVAEADESDASFLHLKPVIAVVTNIDADHMGTYGNDFSRLRAAFLEFLHNLPFYGLAVLCAEDPVLRDSLAAVPRPVVTYGMDAPGADLRARVVAQVQGQTRFVVSGSGIGPLELTLNMPGRHNVLNALAAIAVARELGASEEAIYRALSGFEGIGRRLQQLGEIQLGAARALLIDDYGHHPREIVATLEAVRSGWPGRRVVVAFEPHRYTRTRDLFDDFVEVLAGVESLVLFDVYAAGEAPVEGADGPGLCQALRARGAGELLWLHRPPDLIAALPALIRDGDILVTLGAGSIGALGPEIAARYGVEQRRLASA